MKKKTNLQRVRLSFIMFIIIVSMYFTIGKEFTLKITDVEFWQIFVLGMLFSVIIVNLVAFFKSKSED